MVFPSLQTRFIADDSDDDRPLRPLSSPSPKPKKPSTSEKKGDGKKAQKNGEDHVRSAVAMLGNKLLLKKLKKLGVDTNGINERQNLDNLLMKALPSKEGNGRGGEDAGGPEGGAGAGIKADEPDDDRPLPPSSAATPKPKKPKTSEKKGVTKARENGVEHLRSAVAILSTKLLLQKLEELGVNTFGIKERQDLNNLLVEALQSKRAEKSATKQGKGEKTPKPKKRKTSESDGKGEGPKKRAKKE